MSAACGTGTGLRVVIHAPTPGALARARSNARNLLAARPEAHVLILANAGGVAAALEAPDADTDAYLRLCANTLARQSLTAPAGIATVPAVIVALAEFQAEGWQYVRA